MARFTGSIWKKSRRLGISLTGTGKELERRPYPPGQHGPTQRIKLSEYGMQLQEKQKLRYMYGINERQFRTLFDRSGKMKGVHGENFMILLATRLDAVVRASGLARTQRQARQLVNHGHVTVDGKRVDIPSYLVSPDQVIGLREKSQELALIKNNLENVVSRLDFISYDENSKEGTLTRLPERSELNAEIDESLVVEYYNKLG